MGLDVLTVNRSIIFNTVYLVVLTIKPLKSYVIGIVLKHYFSLQRPGYEFEHGRETARGKNTH